MQIGENNTDNKIFIIAEIGNNHEGSFDVACELIKSAAQAGADAVKFQSIVPDKLVSKKDLDRMKQLKKFSFSRKQFEDLSLIAKKNGVLFMSTPFDLESVDWLNPLVPAYKIASGDNDFFPLLDRVAMTGKPAIVSMGLGGIKHIKELINFFRSAWEKYGFKDPGVGLLHCVVSYPTPLDQADLRTIERLKVPGVTVGYSDHTIGIKAAEIAVAAGARIIEKHFTLDKNFSSFRDHQLSADPYEFGVMVKSIKDADALLGYNLDSIKDAEKSNEFSARRSIAAAHDIAASEVVEWEDLVWIRPRIGMKPGEEHMICGKRLTKPIAGGEAFTLAHFE
ncbi:MAG: hypothetical protein CMM02_06400 [Rhodopirellula sp.]|nr:hypothetical protein [Rhodopirellula sp.]